MIVQIGETPTGREMHGVTCHAIWRTLCGRVACSPAADETRPITCLRCITTVARQLAYQISLVAGETTLPGWESWEDLLLETLCERRTEFLEDTGEPYLEGGR